MRRTRIRKSAFHHQDSRAGQDGQFGVASGQAKLSGTPAATEEGSYERASSKQNHADCEHHKAGRNPPSHPRRDAQHDHYETHAGNMRDTTSRMMKLAMRSTLLDPSLAIRIPRGTDSATLPAPGMAAAVDRL